MRIFARHALVPATLAADESALVLEGDWPARERSASRWSLDRAIDARHSWIDLQASQLAERLAEEPAFRLPCASQEREASLAWINALPLRYFLVKLLRVVALFEDCPLEASEPLTLTTAAGRDDEYLRLIECIASSRAIPLHVLPVVATQVLQQAASSAPRNSSLRRLAGSVNRFGDALLDAMPAAQRNRTSSRPILLCGNPRVLDPVCQELQRRGIESHWLYDRFAFGSWLAWRRRGVRQLVCNSSQASPITMSDTLTNRWLVRGVDLRPAIEVWLNRMAYHRAAVQQHLWRQVAAHVKRLRPRAIVLDEDATPLKRIAVAAARRHNATSLVVQHGAPRVSFGFAPLAADRFLAWGETTRQQLTGWSVPAERVTVCGSSQPWPEASIHGNRRGILLFATVPPSDARPDAVAYHLTSQTHDELIHMACAAVARRSGYELVIKLHPRTPCAKHFERIARSHAGLRFRLVREGAFTDLLSEAACVLNCGSSAGIEAASYGWPVIELLPAGSLELTHARSWGMLGAANTADQLDRLLADALESAKSGRRLPAHGEVFAAVGRQAAARVVDAIVAATSTALTDCMCASLPRPLMEAAI
jgi:hypothetical protein